jgi:hypothetical protein
MPNPNYIACSTFVAVFTPHYQIQAQKRQASPLNPSMLERMWAVGVENECCGFKLNSGFVYYKCIWNAGRNRWELELISFTPANRFHTHDKQFAIQVYP